MILLDICSYIRDYAIYYSNENYFYMGKHIVYPGQKDMARPIGNTPELVGDEANEFIEGMFEPPTEKEKKLKERILNQRRVPL